MSKVRNFYDKNVQSEWERLGTRHRTEFALTMRAIKDFLPPAPARVIDIGGGPGRYALALQEACRLLKAGGLIFAAFISRFAAFRDAAAKGASWVLEKPATTEKILTTGIDISEAEDLNFGPISIIASLKTRRRLALRIISCISVESNVNEA